MNNGDKNGIISLIKLIRIKKTKKQKLEKMTNKLIICINNNSNDKKECDSEYGRAAVSLKTIENDKVLNEIKATSQLDAEKCLANL